MAWRCSCNRGVHGRVSETRRTEWQVRGKGLTCCFGESLPPASEREARMDDPTRRCENDTDKWKRVTRGPCSQARAPLFCSLHLKWDSHFWWSMPTIKIAFPQTLEPAADATDSILGKIRA